MLVQIRFCRFVFSSINIICVEGESCGIVHKMFHKFFLKFSRQNPLSIRRRCDVNLNKKFSRSSNQAMIHVIT